MRAFRAENENKKGESEKRSKQTNERLDGSGGEMERWTKGITNKTLTDGWVSGKAEEMGVAMDGRESRAKFTSHRSCLGVFCS